MSKSSVAFVCRECGGESIRWSGQCPHCRAWNTMEEFRAPRGTSREARGGARPVPITEVDVDAAPRLALAWEELNRALGGGIVPGSLVLLGGEPGVGKSTLLLEVAHRVAAVNAWPRSGSWNRTTRGPAATASSQSQPRDSLISLPDRRK